MKVEEQAQQHRFLETITHTDERRIRVQHSNHNGESMLKMQPPKRLSRPNPRSNISTATIVTQLYGELHRLASNCSDELAIVQAVMELWLELQEFDWPKQWLQMAVQKYMHKNTDEVWGEIYRFIQNA